MTQIERYKQEEEERAAAKLKGFEPHEKVQCLYIFKHHVHTVSANLLFDRFDDCAWKLANVSCPVQLIILLRSLDGCAVNILNCCGVQ